jgi:hypothetical protein
VNHRVGSLKEDQEKIFSSFAVIGWWRRVPGGPNSGRFLGWVAALWPHSGAVGGRPLLPVQAQVTQHQAQVRQQVWLRLPAIQIQATVNPKETRSQAMGLIWGLWYLHFLGYPISVSAVPTRVPTLYSGIS